jgi:hypothetical protein
MMREEDKFFVRVRFEKFRGPSNRGLGLAQAGSVTNSGKTLKGGIAEQGRICRDLSGQSLFAFRVSGQVSRINGNTFNIPCFWGRVSTSCFMRRSMIFSA